MKMNNHARLTPKGNLKYAKFVTLHSVRWELDMAALMIMRTEHFVRGT